MVLEPKEPVRHGWKVQWCYWGSSVRDSGDSQVVKDTLQRHTETLALVPYLKETIWKAQRLQDYFFKISKHAIQSWKQRMLQSLDPRLNRTNSHLLFNFSLSPSQAHIDFHPDIIQRGLHRSRYFFSSFYFFPPVAAVVHTGPAFPSTQILHAEEQGSTAEQALITLFSPMSTEWECLIWCAELRSKC